MNKKLEKKKKKAAERDKKQQQFKDRPHSCGECNACCFLFSMGDKPPKVMCAYVKNGGCSCYDYRPILCKDYKCTWLRNKNLAANLRPDRCGFIMTPRGYYQNNEVVTIEEIKNGGMDPFLYKHVVDWLIRIKAIVVVVKDKGEEVFHKHCGLMDYKAILLWLHGNYDENRMEQSEDLENFSFVGTNNGLEK